MRRARNNCWEGKQECSTGKGRKEKGVRIGIIKYWWCS
jgi:hypothetical protein